MSSLWWFAAAIGGWLIVGLLERGAIAVREVNVDGRVYRIERFRGGRYTVVRRDADASVEFDQTRLLKQSGQPAELALLMADMPRMPSDMFA